MVLWLNTFSNNYRGPLVAFIPHVKDRGIPIHKKTYIESKFAFFGFFLNLSNLPEIWYPGVFDYAESKNGVHIAPSTSVGKWKRCHLRALAPKVTRGQILYFTILCHTQSLSFRRGGGGGADLDPPMFKINIHFEAGRGRRSRPRPARVSD